MSKVDEKKTNPGLPAEVNWKKKVKLSGKIIIIALHCTVAELNMIRPQALNAKFADKLWQLVSTYLTTSK